MYYLAHLHSKLFSTSVSHLNTRICEHKVNTWTSMRTGFVPAYTSRHWGNEPRTLSAGTQTPKPWQHHAPSLPLGFVLICDAPHQLTDHWHCQDVHMSYSSSVWPLNHLQIGCDCAANKSRLLVWVIMCSMMARGNTPDNTINLTSIDCLSLSLLAPYLYISKPCLHFSHPQTHAASAL